MAEGDSMAEHEFGPLTRTHIVRYAGASGDFNPVHHDEEFAKEAGLPGVFGIGMMHAGILGQRLAAWVGPENVRSFSLRFTGQVWPGDVLTFRGVVTGVESAESADPVARIDLTVTRQGGGCVLTAAATARVAPAGDVPAGDR
ncbi:dihydroxy-acid dehydratase [Prauserella sp. PE36]|uniref:Dihydroxy-acid dehydratase n=2 Tax=Pseudonocardiaceae TaxID=2070 RepID=A0ABY2S1M8_9PSEU|nr:dihydroxy-acid dehydratase [Prauserella sp. PE36]TKG68501.1 dihydroxy-acid dehydratase [Prauserella endophytica]